MLKHLAFALVVLAFMPASADARESARAGYSVDAPSGWSRAPSVPPRVIQFNNATPRAAFSIALIGADGMSIALHRSLLGPAPTEHVERLPNGAIFAWRTVAVSPREHFPQGGTEYIGEITLRSVLFRIGGTVHGQNANTAFMIAAMRSVASSLTIDVPISQLPTRDH